MKNIEEYWILKEKTEYFQQKVNPSGSASIASICSNMTTLNFTFICMGSKSSVSNLEKNIAPEILLFLFFLDAFLSFELTYGR